MEVNGCHLRTPVADASQIAQARRTAATLARLANLNDTDTGRVSIIVTEMASNVIKHAGGGELLLRTTGSEDPPGVEIICLDQGPGMMRLSECLQDGYSTGGSVGGGLGAITRQSSSWDIYTHPGKGTAIWAHVRARERTPPPLLADTVVSAGLAVPLEGEELSGDAWWVATDSEGATALLADGLGHGMPAAEAAFEAVRVLRHNSGFSPCDVVRSAHDALRATRGAAVAVARLSRSQSIVHYAGVGNISGTILSGASHRKMVSHNGTVGHGLHKVQEFTYPAGPDAVLILHSDGIASHWDPAAYPGLLAHHPALIAGVLYRDHARGRDDASVVVVKVV